MLSIVIVEIAKRKKKKISRDISGQAARVLIIDFVSLLFLDRNLSLSLLLDVFTARNYIEG